VAARGLLDRARQLAFFAPWLSIPLTLAGIAFAVLVPLILAIGALGWICYAIVLVAAVALALWLRPRYRVAILDSSHLGVLYWLQKRY
jgi:hypothetical protein